MTPEETQQQVELRVLLLAPTDRDADLTCSILTEAKIECLACADIEQVCGELDDGASVVVLPEESIAPNGDDCLAGWLHSQPPWSDLPVLLLSRSGADSAAVSHALDSLGNVTVLERPMRVAALLSAVRTGLRARQRQYQIRAHLLEQRRVAEALRVSDQRKDEFLAILAHELRNPLAPIRSSLDVLRLTKAEDSPVGQVADVLDRQVNLMVRLVDDLLEVSRISRGKIELRNERVEVGAILRSALETSRPLIEAGGHQVTVALPAEPLTLGGDVIRLTQVVANLLNNAAKYSEAGGRIWVAAERREDRVVISVRDEGRGIPADLLPRVFELFHQIEGPSLRPQGGLGIGLTLARSLVELHGGTLEAHSEGAGRGSEFMIRLPHAPAPSAEDSAAGAIPTTAFSRRILLVDDNRDAAESLGLLLRLLGGDVRVAHSGPEALDVAPGFDPDVVLLDIGMPAMDGFEVARRLRALPSWRGATLIALTGWGQEEDRHRTRAAGFDHHLVKPADIGALRELFASLEVREDP